MGHDASDSIRKAVHAYGSTLAACSSASTDACSSIGGLLQKTFSEQVLYLHCCSASYVDDLCNALEYSHIQCMFALDGATNLRWH